MSASAVRRFQAAFRLCERVGSNRRRAGWIGRGKAWWSPKKKGFCGFRQPETFAKPKLQQEIVNSPSFPRRWESWFNLSNGLFLNEFFNIK